MSCICNTTPTKLQTRWRHMKRPPQSWINISCKLSRDMKPLPLVIYKERLAGANGKTSTAQLLDNARYLQWSSQKEKSMQTSYVRISSAWHFMHFYRYVCMRSLIDFYEFFLQWSRYECVPLSVRVWFGSRGQFQLNWSKFHQIVF